MLPYRDANANALRRLILGAEETVHVSVDQLMPHFLDELMSVQLSPRVQKRAIVGSRLSSDDRSVSAIEQYEKLMNAGWQVHVLFALSLPTFAIVDGRAVMRCRIWRGSHAGGGIWYELTSDRDEVSNFQVHFDEFWTSAEPLEVLYVAKPTLWTPFAIPTLTLATADVYNRLLADLRTNPTLLHRLDPFGFEQIVAELLRRQGSTAHVTPKRKDGGFDILARHMTPLGEMMYLVECKRWSPENPVGLEIVNALYGVVERRNATGGMIVTTSRFTRGALEVARTLEHRLTLADYERLQNWLDLTVPPA